jgi:hypothetical protein
MKAAQTQKVEESPTKLEKRGEIVRVALDGQKATINLGRSSGVTPQTTFAIHGRQPNGLPKPLSKGNVEVLSVGDNTSEVLIRSIFDPADRGDPLTGRRREITYAHRDNTDPITRGDVLVNPLWDPNKKTHIAVAGILDFSGTGAFNIESFIRMMERQNIVLDSYIDPTDGQIKGAGITRRTDYVILGGTVTVREAGVSKDENVIKAINDNRAKVIDEAKRNGVGLISLRRFMKETGFTLPRTATVD